MTLQPPLPAEALPSEEFNPYEPPAADPDISSQPAEEPTDAELRAFVGRNAEVYLRKWAPMRRSKPMSTGRSWPAFFFALSWMAYRKMYRYSAYLLAFLLVEIALEDLLFIFILGRAETPALLASATGLVVAVYCAMFANAWYYRMARQKILELRPLHAPGPELEAALARAGGTHLGASLVALVVMLSAFALLGIAGQVVLEALLPAR